MTADEARNALKNLYHVSRYTYDKALDSAQMTGYYRIEMSDGRNIEVTFDADGFHVSPA